MKNKIRVGDEVKLLGDVRDSCGEVYISKHEVVEVEDFRPDQKGYEYGLPYGFYVGADVLELMKSHATICEVRRNSRTFLAYLKDQNGRRLGEITDKVLTEKLIKELDLQVEYPSVVKRKL